MGIRKFIKKHFFKDFIKNAEILGHDKALEEFDYKLAHEAYVRYVMDTKNKAIKKLIDFSQNPNPKVSIIIPVYNQYNVTLECLNSIKNNTTENNYEIIIVDDCSSDETKSIAENIKNIRIIRNEKNLGFLKNCNKAVKEARGEYIYLLNNDTYVFPDAINSLTDVLDHDLSVGAVGSKLIRSNGKLQEAGSLVKSDGWTIALGNNDNPLLDKYNQQKEVDYCSGASLMIRKRLWDELKGFDEIYSPGYYEETDFCMRLKTKGYKVMYCPKSEIMHYVSLSFSDKANNLMIRNHKIFKNRWLKAISRKGK